MLTWALVSPTPSRADVEVRFPRARVQLPVGASGTRTVMIPIDYTAAQAPLRERPIERLKCELLAAFLTFIPHRYNNHTRKVVTIVLAVGWMSMTVLVSTELAVATPTYGALTAIVFAIVGRMWNIEVGALPARAAPDANSKSDPDEER